MTTKHALRRWRCCWLLLFVVSPLLMATTVSAASVVTTAQDTSKNQGQQPSDAGHAVWQLNNDLSRLSFVVTDNPDGSSVHTFEQLVGSIDPTGAAQVHIQLASVRTLIPAFTLSLVEWMLEAAAVTTVQVKAGLPETLSSTMSQGAVQMLTTPATLTIKGKVVPLQLDFAVTRIDANRLLLASAQPYVLTAAALGAPEKINQLRQLTGLGGLSLSVPISFILVFDLQQGSS